MNINLLTTFKKWMEGHWFFFAQIECKVLPFCTISIFNLFTWIVKFFLCFYKVYPAGRKKKEERKQKSTTDVLLFFFSSAEKLLFRNKKFMLDEIIYQNASKFAILLEYLTLDLLLWTLFIWKFSKNMANTLNMFHYRQFH